MGVKGGGEVDKVVDMMSRGMGGGGASLGPLACTRAPAGELRFEPSARPAQTASWSGARAGSRVHVWSR